MTIEVGDVVPIRVQIKDGQAGLKVLAQIFDDIGKPIKALQLIHAEKGLYFSNMFRMPDVPNITVQISVDGLDKNGEPYGSGSETFYSKPKVAPADKYLVGELTERQKLESIYEGVLNETEIVE
jgi:hypothetical protein